MKRQVATLSIIAILGAGGSIAQGQHNHGPKSGTGAEQTQPRATQESELDRTMAALKRAQGSAKIDAMAAVIEELVAENKRLAAAQSHQTSGHASQGSGSKQMECPMMSKEAAK